MKCAISRTERTSRWENREICCRSSHGGHWKVQRGWAVTTITLQPGWAGPHENQAWNACRTATAKLEWQTVAKSKNSAQYDADSKCKGEKKIQIKNEENCADKIGGNWEIMRKKSPNAHCAFQYIQYLASHFLCGHSKFLQGFENIKELPKHRTYQQSLKILISIHHHFLWGTK